MIHYSCKYAPIELFAAFGEEAVLLDSEEENFERAQDNLYLLDLPHEDNGCARELFAGALTALAHDLETATGKQFDRERFFAACQSASWSFPQEDFIALLGGCVSPELQRQVEDEMSLAVVNLTCCGSRGLEPLPGNAAELDFAALMNWYAHALLRMVPCMRMTDVSGRRVLFENPRLKGIIYNTVKFCDFYSFDYAALKDATMLPILKIESDYMPMAQGQLSTRLEAFSESLGLTGPKRMNEKDTNMQGRYYAGIDSGSTTTNMGGSILMALSWQVRSCVPVRRQSAVHAKRSSQYAPSLRQPPPEDSSLSWQRAMDVTTSLLLPTRRPRSAVMRTGRITSIPLSAPSSILVAKIARSFALMRRVRSRTSS